MTKNSESSLKVLEEAINILKEVKSKIDGLIDCSVKDFEVLNANFKRYFNNLQKISEATNNFISFILDTNQHKALIELSDPDHFDKEKIFKRLTNYTEQLKQVHKNFNFYQLLISNLKQDLSTIRLLFTNLKFDPSIIADYNKVNEIIESIGKQFESQEIQLSKISNSLNSSISFTEEGFFNGIELFGNQIDKIREALMHLINLSYSAKQQRNKLEQLDKKRKSSTSEIITNLQFQDILRQKIEHVQSAHSEIIAGLISTHKDEETFNEEELFKLRDINTLQSAQLIHANQEYQRAVEVIVHKINELNTLLNCYQSIWNHFCKPEGAKFIMIKTKLTEKTSIINSQSFSINQVYDKFLIQTEKIEEEFNNTIKTINNNNKLFNEISTIKNIADSINQNLVKTNKSTSIEQIKGEIDKLQAGSEKLTKLLSEYLHKENQKEKFPKIDIKSEIELIKNFSIQITSFYNSYLNDQIDHFNSSIQIDTSISFSIEHVAYYKTFEKEVNEIINLLDDLLSNINVSKNEIKKERLEHLEKLYTMESEREIHKLVTGNVSEKKNSDKKKDDNEVEFF